MIGSIALSKSKLIYSALGLPHPIAPSYHTNDNLFENEKLIFRLRCFGLKRLSAGEIVS